MATPLTYGELICDGMHIKPGALKAFIAAKGWDHTPLVTDCLRCGGMPEGDYMLGDFPIRMENNLAHLVMEDGTTGNIAGSVLTLAEAVQNVVKDSFSLVEMPILTFSMRSFRCKRRIWEVNALIQAHLHAQNKAYSE